MEWSGSCHGMAVFAVLNWNGNESIANVNSKYAELSEVVSLNNDMVESAINFYQFQGVMSDWITATDSFMKLNQSKQFDKLEECGEQANSDGSPFIISIQYYRKNDSGKYEKHAHTLVGYRLETGTYDRTVNGISKTYTKKINIYDCAMVSSR